MAHKVGTGDRLGKSMSSMARMHGMNGSKRAPKRDLDLALLPVLEVLLTESNVTRAAQRLDLSQPTLSHALARAREAFGDPLLVKSGRGLVLTRRAEAILPALRRVLEEVEALRETDWNPARLRRTFRVATSDQGQLMLLPPLLQRLSREAPGVMLDVAMLPEAVDAALDRDLDLVITARARTSPRLRQAILGTIPVVCIVRKGRRTAGRTALTLAEFRALPKVLVVPTLGLREVARAGDRGAAEKNVQARVTQFMVAAALVAQSDLACTIDVASAAELARHLPLRILPLPPSIPPVTIVMHWHERDDRDPAHVWFRNLIKSITADGMKRSGPPRSRRLE